MTDRELLEMAAKAYWGDEIDDVVSVEWSEREQAILYTHGENQDHNGRDVTLVWNPLENEFDAFELAVKLRIDIQFETIMTPPYPPSVHCCGEKGCYELPLGDIPEMAVCRAITLAAAAIGENMP